MGRNLAWQWHHLNGSVPRSDPSTCHSCELDFPIPAANGATTAWIPPDPLLRQRVFRFSESTIDKIKAAANANRPQESRPFSTFQSLAVRLWPAMTRARGLEPEDVTVLTILMDCRKQVEPAMPDSYAGNLIQAVLTGTATGCCWPILLNSGLPCPKCEWLAQCSCHCRPIGGIWGLAEPVPVQGSWNELCGGRQLAACTWVRMGGRVWMWRLASTSMFWRFTMAY